MAEFNMPAAHTRDRAELEKAIKNSGSVMLPDGRIVSRVEDLPAESALAAGDRDRLQAEHDRLQGVVDAHTKQLADVKKQLDAADKAAGATAKSAAADGDVAAKLQRLPADELKALCDEHGCEHGTKAEMAEALAAKGVTPPE